MSPVRSLLVSTMVDSPARETYFEGVTRLCTHDLNGAHYYHMGFYCNDGKTPVTQNEIPEDFRRNEPGTSISLVGRYSDLGSIFEIEESIERAVISNFWLAIFEKKLIVTVGQRESLTSKTLEEKMKALYKEDYERGNPFLFYKAYATPEDNRQYYRFKLTNDPLLGNCELRLRIGDSGKLDKVTYMRDLMMLIQTKGSPKQRHSGIRATFICLGEPGNSNLELTEDESHSSWSTHGKSGEAKKKAKAVLDKIDSFIIDCIESIMKGESEKIDVSIDSLSMEGEEMRSIESQDGTGGNPFGAIKEEGKTSNDGFERISSPLDLTKKEEILDRGAIVSGPSITAKDGVGNTAAAKGRIGITPTHPHPHPSPKPGKARTKTRIDPNGEKFYRIIPADFAVAAHKETGRWVHTLWIDPDITNFEPDGKAYLDLSVGSDSNNSIKVAIEKALLNGKPLPISESRITLDSTPESDFIIEITFVDNLRHTINLE